ncbi:hypothetical protein [Marinimicrococcus flavescens]|uniref:Uncharacterized protein n=1 Tax=Marinimicrococcus flavescens TaxID=3031815 RepID=A0AAP3XS88_9PROT|nr:hypothetical protein [Marinimicrococcus flavescens]
MDEKEFWTKVTGLRAMKSVVIRILKSPEASKNKGFREMAEKFKDQIPSKNKDLEWNHDLKGFATRFEELESEYLSLYDWNRRLKETPETKSEKIEEKDFLKKEPQIKEGQVSLSLRGGARPGAGRKSLGVKRKVSIVLPAEDWEYIDSLVADKKFASVAEYFRHSTGLGL